MGEYKEHLGESYHVGPPLSPPLGLNIAMLPKGKPHPEHHLGSAKDPHIRSGSLTNHIPILRVLLGANYPQPRMLLRSQELYEPIPDRDYRESLYESPLPHSALLLLLLCSTKSLLSSLLAEVKPAPLSHIEDCEATRLPAVP